VRFYPVSEAELERFRDDFRAGRAQVRIEDALFDLDEHERGLAEDADAIAVFKARQQAAFTAEVALWHGDVGAGAAHEDENQPESTDGAGSTVAAEMSGNVWKLMVEPGQAVRAGEVVAILEAMKMEFSVQAPHAGTVTAVYCRAGRMVHAGQALFALDPVDACAGVAA